MTDTLIADADGVYHPVGFQNSAMRTDPRR
jgi:hypothetical protein